MDAWFVSDLHIENFQSRNGQVLLRFLQSIAEKQRPATHLFFVGDIFDVWVGPSPYFKTLYFPFINLLQAIKSLNVQIYYLEGNHDFHLKNILTKDLNIPVFSTELSVLIGSHKVFLSHGDLMNSKNMSYKRLRNLLRSKTVGKLSEVLPGRFIHFIGEKWSQTSRNKKPKKTDRNEGMIKNYIQDYSKRLVHRQGHFDFIITGHLHLRETFYFLYNSELVQSINLGSWIEDTPAAYYIGGDERHNRHEFIELT